MIRPGAPRSLGRQAAIAALLVLASGLQACDALGGFLGWRETRLSHNLWGNVEIEAGGRGFTLSTADGKPLNGQLQVVVMGWPYPAEAGKLVLPALALQQIKDKSEGFFLVMAPGYVPRRVWMGQPEDQIVLQPVTPVQRFVVPPRGGRLTTPDQATSIVVPPNLTRNAGTKAPELGVATYTPEITAADNQALTTARNGFMAKLRGGNYRLAEACEGEEAPLPCPPVQHALGLLVSVNDEIVAPAKLDISYDLVALLDGWDGNGAPPAGWPADKATRAQAAARILRTFRQIEQIPEDDKRSLAREMINTPEAHRMPLPGLKLENDRTLVIPVPITAEASGDAYFHTRNLTSLLLGVKLEITIVSTRFTPLPGVLAPALIPVPPGQIVSLGGNGIVSNNGGTLIGNNGAGVVSTGGGGVVSTGGGGIIGNNGGAMVGRVDSPVATGFAPKYRLKAYTELPQAGLMGVDATDHNDNPLAVAVPTDAGANYRLTNINDSRKFIFGRYRSGAVTLRGVAPAPGVNGTVECNLNTATTAVTSWILDEIRRGRGSVNLLSPAGYTSDVAQFAPLLSTLNQAEADTIATGSVPAIADIVRAKWPTLAPYRPASFALVRTLAGSGPGSTWADGTGMGAGVDAPSMAAFDAAGRLIVTCGDGMIRRVDPASGVVTTLAGLPGIPPAPAPPAIFFPINGNQASATMYQPWGVAVAPTGNLLVAEHRTGQIRRIDMVAGPTSPTYVTTFAGSRELPLLDGVAGGAQFGLIAGIARNPVSGDYFVADCTNHAIRRVTPMGVVTTFAGSLSGLDGHLDGTGTAARFRWPTGLCFDGGGNLIVSDRDNHAIRHITPAGVVTTLAGSGYAGYFDGAGPVAQFNEPRGVQVDQDGGVLVVDSANNRLRRINPDQTVVTIAGTGAAADGPEGVEPLQASFDLPYGLLLGPDGEMYVMDANNDRIRVIRTP